MTAACRDARSLCAVRVLTGFCAFWVLGETLISKVAPGGRVAELKAKYLGGALLGQIFGPVNGGVLGTVSWALPCYVASGCALLAALRLGFLLASGGATAPKGDGAPVAAAEDRSRKARIVLPGGVPRTLAGTDAVCPPQVFDHPHYRAAVYVYACVGLNFTGASTVLYAELVYRYGLREWEVGVFGLALCVALILSLLPYDYWFRTRGAYGVLAIFGPAGALSYFALAVAAKGGVAAFGATYVVGIFLSGPCFNTATMIVTNVARTYAPGTEGTALSYASLLHNAAQAAGPVVFMYLRTAVSWRAPWLMCGAVTLSYVAVAVGVRVAYPLPPDTFLPSCAFEARVFGCAPPLAPPGGRAD